jgi:hypothetical protein
MVVLRFLDIKLRVSAAYGSLEIQQGAMVGEHHVIIIGIIGISESSMY